MFGNLGDDDMIGGDERDWMFGNRGEDDMIGENDNDRVRGNRHDDDLWGGPGVDILIGDLGSDTTNQNGSSGLSFDDANCGEIRGLKWEDLDGDGIRDPGEPLFSGVTVFLDANNNGVRDRGEKSQKTVIDNPFTHEDTTGKFRFSFLAPGTHIVREQVPSGFTQTAPAGGSATVVLAPRQIVEGIEFGNARNCLPNASRDACESTSCPDGRNQCLPVCVRVVQIDIVEVIECECMDPQGCHTEIHPGAPPTSVGSCPEGMRCVQELEHTPAGDILCCKCVPIDDCRPTADQSACEAITCANFGETCNPTCMNYDPCSGEIKFLECDCSADGCFVDINVPEGTQPTCATNTCPAGQQCNEIITKNCDGTLDICCNVVHHRPGSASPSQGHWRALRSYSRTRIRSANPLRCRS
jgi:hypothetical protein